MKNESSKNQLSVVIVSDARLNKKVTLECVESLKNEKVHEIIVVESDPNTVYKGCIMVHPTVEFNYNKYLNLGAEKATGYYIAFCNNDLIFTKGWWTRLYDKMIKNNVVSASPICPNTHQEFGFSVADKVEFGNQIRKFVAGWCIVLDRLWYLKMGKFDERFAFWCADNSYGKQMEEYRVRHMLDCGSVVHHVQSATLNLIDDGKKDEYTRKQVIKYNIEFNESLFNL